MKDENVLYIDEDPRNADWLRTMHWDLPTTLSSFLARLGVVDSPVGVQRASVEKFMRLPAAEAMPKSLRRELMMVGLLS